MAEIQFWIPFQQLKVVKDVTFYRDSVQMCEVSTETLSNMQVTYLTEPLYKVTLSDEVSDKSHPQKDTYLTIFDKVYETLSTN